MKKLNRNIENVLLFLALMVWVLLGTVAPSGAGEPLLFAGMDQEGAAGTEDMDGEDYDKAPGMGMSGMMPTGPYFKTELGLNEDQTERMHKLYSDYEKELIRNRSAVQITELELADILDEKKIDMSAVEKAVKKVENLRSEMTLYRVKALMKTQEFLTPQQFEKYKDLIVSQMRYPMHGGYGGMMMGHRRGMMPGMMDKRMPRMMPEMMPGQGGAPGSGTMPRR